MLGDRVANGCTGGHDRVGSRRGGGMIGPMGVSAEEVRYRGRAGIALEAEGVSAVFLPDAGMTGVSLRFGGSERLSLPGGVPRVEGGGTAGLPLLAPWANRLASRRFRSGGTEVDLRDAPVRTDDNGLPIHGLLLGSPRWQVTELATRGSTARLGTSIAVDEPSFPFAHRIDLLVTARERALVVDTTVTPTGRRPVPVAFGWHPYLRLPDVPRSQWRLRLPRPSAPGPRSARAPDRRRGRRARRGRAHRSTAVRRPVRPRPGPSTRLRR